MIYKYIQPKCKLTYFLYHYPEKLQRMCTTQILHIEQKGGDLSNTSQMADKGGSDI